MEIRNLTLAVRLSVHISSVIPLWPLPSVFFTSDVDKKKYKRRKGIIIYIYMTLGFNFKEATFLKTGLYIYKCQGFEDTLSKDR